MPGKRNKEYYNNDDWEYYNSDDWKQWKMGWPYKGDIEDPVYLMERSELFKENGNGWWWYQGLVIKSA